MDVRQIDEVDLSSFDTIFHLANIANDPSVELNPYASWEVNVLAAMRLVDRAARQGVKQFVFASSAQRLRPEVRAAGHGGARALPDLRIQQDQDGRRARRPELRRFDGDDDHPAGDGLRLLAADAAGSHRQPADDAGADQGRDDGARRRARRGRTSTSTISSTSISFALDRRLAGVYNAGFEKSDGAGDRAAHRGARAGGDQGPAVERSAFVPSVLGPPAGGRVRRRRRRRRPPSTRCSAACTAGRLRTTRRGTTSTG